MAVNATAIWRVRPSGSNTNGGGYDPGISGAATDYSQQNAAQATGTLGTASGTATFTDAGGAFTAAMVGNALWIASGAGFTVGAYFIVTFNSTTSVVLDRSPGTGTVAHWALGGGWADFWTNTQSGPVVSGNTIYILGSGTPNPSSYVYDYNATSGAINIGPTSGEQSFYLANDPSTPGYKAPPDTTGGMPVIKWNVNSNLFTTAGGAVYSKVNFSGLWIVATAVVSAGNVAFGGTAGGMGVFGCVVDQFAQDVCGVATGGGNGTYVTGTEIFSSVAPGSPGTNYAIQNNSQIFTQIIGCNIHDCVGNGISFATTIGASVVASNVIAKCLGTESGIKCIYLPVSIINNTIDGNGGDGVLFTNGIMEHCLLNNIISNHTAAGKHGVNFTTGDIMAQIFDYNTFYNNTANYGGGLVAGPHDTALGVTPYVASATENYTLA